MQTSAIRYRVVDFLQRHAPFHAMEEEDLLALVAGGRVRFHEVDEHVYWQGQPPGPHVFVVQQGTVSLWEDGDGGARLRDVRGPGDLLGIDGLLGAPVYRQSAKAAGDVVLYALPAAEFQSLIGKYPSAARYLAAHATVHHSYEGPDARPGRPAFIHQVVRARPLLTVTPAATVAEVARLLHERAGSAVAVVGDGGRLRGVVTAERLVRWAAEGAADVSRPAESLVDAEPLAASPDATVESCVLAMAEAGAAVLAVTDGGARGGRVHGLVGTADLAPAFGDHPLPLVREVSSAGTRGELHALNSRVRAFILQQLTAPSLVEWLSRLDNLFDTRLVSRILDLEPPGSGAACWFFYGASGRAESMTALSPQLGLVFADEERADTWRSAYRRVFAAFPDCGYLGRADLADGDVAFRCAALGEWKERFRGWVRDPLGAQVYLGRPMFDLRAVCGPRGLLDEMEALIRAEVAAHPEFLGLLAHDCLANLPPLAFFRDAVVEEGGSRQEVFHLERSALRPLVDVGRVFGLAVGRVFETSTLARLDAARAVFTADDATLREAADTLRVLLYHQARYGLRRQDGGNEIAPDALSGYDRQVLRSGFRSILRLLERTAAMSWAAR